MKIAFFFLSLLFISCSTKEKKEENNDKEINMELTFEETQDSLRTLILNSKPNKNIKSSILQELYIRGLVHESNGKIKFELPFNLHSFDCGAPDCYSTDITFEIIANEPIEFPKIINFKLLEHGCEIVHEISEVGIFELVEQSANYVNYFSKNQKSNLIILGEKRELYYFPDTKPNSIKVDLLDKIFANYYDEDSHTIAPYQSTIMTTNEYGNFIENE